MPDLSNYNRIVHQTLGFAASGSDPLETKGSRTGASTGANGNIMKNEFIELTGKTLLDVVNEGEVDLGQLHDAGVVGDSILRINRYGEIELRKKSSWIMVGGLIGNFEERLREMTGLDWAA